MAVLDIPLKPAVPFADAIPEPTKAEQAALEMVQQHFERLQGLPMAKGSSETTPLGESDRFFLSREGMLRFIGASKGNAATAIDRLEATLVWRREWNVDGLTREYISPEQESGKQLVFGFDNAGRPNWVMRPRLQNTTGASCRFGVCKLILVRIRAAVAPCRLLL
jgi:hypothetical protein